MKCLLQVKRALLQEDDKKACMSLLQGHMGNRKGPIYEQMQGLYQLFEKAQRDPSYLLKRLPKVDALKEILSQQLSVDGRVLVFVHLRSTVFEILQELRALPGVRAREFIGQRSVTSTASSAGSGSSSGPVQVTLSGEKVTSNVSAGLSQAEQMDILDKFNRNVYNVLVATSIAEEGLDINEVDLIVLFDSVFSPIRYIQRCGRTGRHKQGKVVVISNGDDEGVDEEDKLVNNTETISKLNKMLKQSLYSVQLHPGSANIFQTLPALQMQEMTLPITEDKKTATLSQYFTESSSISTNAISTGSVSRKSIFSSNQMNMVDLLDEEEDCFVALPPSKPSTTTAKPVVSLAKTINAKDEEDDPFAFVFSGEHTVAAKPTSKPITSYRSNTSQVHVPSQSAALAAKGAVSSGPVLKASSVPATAPTPTAGSSSSKTSSTQFFRSEVKLAPAAGKVDEVVPVKPKVAPIRKIGSITHSYITGKAPAAVATDKSAIEPQPTTKTSTAPINPVTVSAKPDAPVVPPVPPAIAIQNPSAKDKGLLELENFSFCYEVQQPPSNDDGRIAFQPQASDLIFSGDAKSSGNLLMSPPNNRPPTASGGKKIRSIKVIASSANAKKADSFLAVEELPSLSNISCLTSQSPLLPSPKAKTKVPVLVKDTSPVSFSQFKYQSSQTSTAATQIDSPLVITKSKPSSPARSCRAYDYRLTPVSRNVFSAYDRCCSVCLGHYRKDEVIMVDSDDEAEDVWLECRQCSQVVHADCYGIPAEHGQYAFTCEPCQNKGPPAFCVLCRQSKGLLKDMAASDEDRRFIEGHLLKPSAPRSDIYYVHTLCVMFIPELHLDTSMRCENISAIDPERIPLYCFKCRSRGCGAVQCASKHCTTSYHTYCAFNGGIYLGMFDGKDGIFYAMYCPEHEHEVRQLRGKVLSASKSIPICMEAGTPSPIGTQAMLMDTEEKRKQQRDSDIDFTQPAVPVQRKRLRKLHQEQPRKRPNKANKASKAASKFFELEADLSGSDSGDEIFSNETRSGDSDVLSGDFINDGPYTQRPVTQSPHGNGHGKKRVEGSPGFYLEMNHRADEMFSQQLPDIYDLVNPTHRRRRRSKARDVIDTPEADRDESDYEADSSSGEDNEETERKWPTDNNTPGRRPAMPMPMPAVGRGMGIPGRGVGGGRGFGMALARSSASGVASSNSMRPPLHPLNSNALQGRPPAPTVGLFKNKPLLAATAKPTASTSTSSASSKESSNRKKQDEDAFLPDDDW